ncbi:MAG TPA: FAD-dependent monooxygenase [Streptosporangiaceae bacterium]|nr:FAD-dependent monooxygenase [Streptosporangiaceae bacterium]
MNEQAPLPASTGVLIVGAGPVGLTLAASLAAAGVPAVLVDKQAAGANTSRACVVHSRTLEVLRELKVSEELVSRGLIVPRFTVRDRDRVLMTIDFDDLPTDFPYTLMIPQDSTERVLLDRLHRAGGQVHRPYELTSLAQDGDGVTGTMASGETIRAGYAVGADGMHSNVRDHTGISFTGDTYAQSFVLADVHMDWHLPETEVMLYYSPAGLVVVSALPGGRHRIVATVDDAPEHPDGEFVQALLDARGPEQQPARIRDVVWSSRFRVHHRLADHYRAGRLFLAGDAAHVHSPAGGQGMNTGIQDAVALAARLTAVLRDGSPDSMLDEYETERRPVAAEVVALTHRITRIATVDSVPLRKTRNALLRALDWVPAAHHALAMKLSELSVDPHRGAKN